MSKSASRHYLVHMGNNTNLIWFIWLYLMCLSFFRRRQMLESPKLPRFSRVDNYGDSKQWDLGNTIKTNFTSVNLWNLRRETQLI